MWIGVLWAGLRVAMWITHVGGKFRHGLLEKSLTCFRFCFPSFSASPALKTPKPVLLHPNRLVDVKKDQIRHLNAQTDT